MSDILEKINQANAEIKPTLIKRKQKQQDGTWLEVDTAYCEVKERVKAFRKVFPLGQITTNYKIIEGFIVFEAVIVSEGIILSTGHARAKLDKAFALEDTETSAIGRALGNFGIGIDTSIASADDMEQLDKTIFDEPTRKDIVNEYQSLFSNKEQVNVLNYYKVNDLDKLNTDILKELINAKRDSNGQ